MNHSDREKKALITDVDNTLFDWFDVWHASFTAMVREILVAVPGIDKVKLQSEMRAIFQKHRTSEYSHVLEECESLQGLSVKRELAPAVEAYRNARKSHLVLYPGVFDTLTWLKRNDIKVIAYTESIRYYTADRLARLNVDSLIDVLYSPADHVLPAGVTPYPDPAPSLIKRETPVGETKPNVHVLRSILEDEGLAPEDCVYIGDSRTKDIAMANEAGVLSVLAAFGSTSSRGQDYELLKMVSHWTDADIEKEKLVNAGQIRVEPDFTADTFADIRPHFEATK